VRARASLRVGSDLEVGGLLRGQLLPDGHDGDRVTACHHLGYALENLQDRLGDRERLAARPDELALRRPLRWWVRDRVERTRQRLDLRALLRRGSNGSRRPNCRSADDGCPKLIAAKGWTGAIPGTMAAG